MKHNLGVQLKPDDQIKQRNTAETQLFTSDATVQAMETESVKSESSSRSRRSRGHRDRNNYRQHSHRSSR